eukprot:GHVT01069903.1.p3 GENE.GHVT01069903.1~~GHVT01069903.1.p3  ORF type:complete len:136 (+),score=4.84 GHVT01069903.1:2605-3012(+)
MYSSSNIQTIRRPKVLRAVTTIKASSPQGESVSGADGNSRILDRWDAVTVAAGVIGCRVLITATGVGSSFSTFQVISMGSATPVPYSKKKTVSERPPPKIQWKPSADKISLVCSRSLSKCNEPWRSFPHRFGLPN